MNRPHKFPAAAQQPDPFGCPIAVTSAPSLGEGAVISADASQISPADFARFTRTYFAPTPTRLSERGDAAAVFIGKVFAGEDAEVARAEMHARFAEIDERYLHEEVMLEAQVNL